MPYKKYNPYKRKKKRTPRWWHEDVAFDRYLSQWNYGRRLFMRYFKTSKSRHWAYMQWKRYGVVMKMEENMKAREVHSLYKRT